MPDFDTEPLSDSVEPEIDDVCAALDALAARVGTDRAEAARMIAHYVDATRDRTRPFRWPVDGC